MFIALFTFYLYLQNIKHVLTQRATYRQGCEHFTRLNFTHPPNHQAQDTHTYISLSLLDLGYLRIGS